MYLMFHHVTVLTRSGLDHGSPTNRLSSGSCLGDPSLANRPLLILKKLSPLSQYCRDFAVVFSQIFFLIANSLSRGAVAYGQLAGVFLRLQLLTTSPNASKLIHLICCLNFSSGEIFKPSPRTV